MAIRIINTATATVDIINGQVLFGAELITPTDLNDTIDKIIQVVESGT